MKNTDHLKHNRYIFLFIFVVNLLTSTQIFAFTQLEQSAQPRYVLGVKSIVTDHKYLQQHPALMYWKLSPFYLPQRNDTSCSLASTTTIVNAARSSQDLNANAELATQDKLLARVNNQEWAKGVAVQGDGITLDQLKGFLPKALDAYGLSNFTVEAVHVNDTSIESAKKLHDVLVTMEKTGTTFIIGNFDQKFFSGTETAGHFSPIGAYDAANKRVLIMDVDRALFEPYWAPEKLVLESMATKDSDANKNRGYLVISFSPKNTH